MTDCPYCGKKCFIRRGFPWPVCPDHGTLTREDCAAAKRGSDHERADHWRALALRERARADEAAADADELLKLHHAELVATADAVAGGQWHVVPDRQPPAPTCDECRLRRVLETIAMDNEPAHRMRMRAKRALKVQ